MDPGSGRYTEGQMNINTKDESSRHLGPQDREVQKLESCPSGGQMLFRSRHKVTTQGVHSCPAMEVTDHTLHWMSVLVTKGETCPGLLSYPPDGGLLTQQSRFTDLYGFPC